MRKLRVVKDGEAAVEVSLSDALRAITDECISDSPEIVFMAWEVEGKMSVRSLPKSGIVERAFVDTLYEEMYKDEDDD